MNATDNFIAMNAGEEPCPKPGALVRASAAAMRAADHGRAWPLRPFIDASEHRRAGFFRGEA